MRYADRVALAPPGSDHFTVGDLMRLSRTGVSLLFEPGPGSPPLEEAAAALGDDADRLLAVARCLPGARGERLLRLAQQPVAPAEREAARHRLVRGAFWQLVYELMPEVWDRIAASEPVAPELLADLPIDGARVVEVGAGTGRLTASMVSRAAAIVAVEPSPALRRLLKQRLPGVVVVAGVGQRLPVVSGWADAVVSCATFGPDAPMGGEEVRAELERCARPGGVVALVGTREPGWWQERGYRLAEYPVPAATFDADLEAFVGPPIPPFLLLSRRIP